MIYDVPTFSAYSGASYYQIIWRHMFKLAIKAQLQTLLPIKPILPSSSSGIRDRKESDVRLTRILG